MLKITAVHVIITAVRVIITAVHVIVKFAYLILYLGLYKSNFFVEF